MRAEKAEQMNLWRSTVKESGEQQEIYTGRIGQFFIYLGKQFRLFVFQSDWKVLPMSAIIAVLVSIAVGRGLFQTMEGTFQGTFALTCVCIWNGFFNSIQAICRERAIIKREHRAGLHITSYVAAHIVYQFFLCASQVAITLIVCRSLGVQYPAKDQFGLGITTELFITLLLITFASDMMALMISAIVHTQMAAMTVMPFMLIIQLVFSGFIALPDYLKDVSRLMISKWGVQGLCVISDYNSLPAVMIWNKMASGGDRIDIVDGVTMKDVLDVVEQEGMRETVLEKLSQANQRPDFAAVVENLTESWRLLILFSIVFAVVTVVFLEFIDRDKR